MKTTNHMQHFKKGGTTFYSLTFLQRCLFIILISLLSKQVNGQDAAMGYNNDSSVYYTQKLSIGPVTFNTSTPKEFIFSVSGITSIANTKVCNKNTDCYVFGSNSYYQEVSLTAASSAQSISTITFGGSSNNADTCKAAIVYSDKIPFSDSSVLAAETVVLPASSGVYSAWKKINGNIPAGTKSVRFYRQVYYGSGSISTGSGNGRVLYGASNTVRLASIVASADVTLPLKFINASAVRKGNSISIEWSIADFQNDATFQIERSNNSLDYEKIVTLNSQSNLNNYKWEDNNLLHVNYFYRIKAIDKNGDITYSNVLSVKSDKQEKSSISVYPNPIKNKALTLMLHNITKGIYLISIYNVNGQQVYNSSLNYNGLDECCKLNISHIDQKGTYYLVLKNDEHIFKQTIVIE